MLQYEIYRHCGANSVIVKMFIYITEYLSRTNVGNIFSSIYSNCIENHNLFHIYYSQTAYEATYYKNNRNKEKKQGKKRSETIFTPTDF